MRAVVLDENGVAFREDYPTPDPTDGMISVRVLRAGVCETDLQLMQGYMGFRGVLGHEFVGVAESGRFAAQRVVGEINCACRNCDTCRNGLENHCPHRTVIGILNHDGAFSDSVLIPEANLHPVPSEVSTDVAVFTEPLAAAFQILEQVPIDQQTRVTLLGDGRLGNLCAQVIQLTGASVTVIGKHPRKLKLLEDRGCNVELLDHVKPSRSSDVVIDCTGSPTGLPTAYRFVKPRGTIVLKTTVAGAPAVSLAEIVIDEITVIGSRCGPFPRALAALAQREVDVAPLIDETFPLSEAVAALDRARSKDTLKVLLHVS